MQENWPQNIFREDMKVSALHLQHSVLCSLTDKCVSERQVSKSEAGYFYCLNT